jgi:hypothetical protein
VPEANNCKTSATYHDEHVPESSVEILGHSVGGIPYRHDAHRSPLAFKAIRTIPHLTAFSALIKGFDGEGPCCRRRFPDKCSVGDHPAGDHTPIFPVPENAISNEPCGQLSR